MARKAIMRVSWLLILWLSTVAVWSEPTLTIVHLSNQSQIDPSEMSAIFERAQRYFSQYGITFRANLLSTSRPLCPNLEIEKMPDQLICLEREAKRLGLETKKRKKLIYFLVPRWTFDEGRRTLYGGMSINYCHNISMGTADHESYSGNSTNISVAGDILAHEVSHLMCASHIEGYNLMNPRLQEPKSPGALLPIEELTKMEVVRWYSRRRRDRA